MLATALPALFAVHAQAGSEAPLARVGEVSISVTDVQAALASIPSSQREVFTSSEFSARNLAAELLSRRILAERAREQGLTDDPIIAARLRLIQERALYELWIDREERAAIDTSKLEALALDEYRAHPERYRQGERVRARHILVSATQPSEKQAALARAQALLERLRSGEDFLELARTQSADPGSAPRGGDLGFFPRGKMVKAFEDAAFALKAPGQLSDLVESEFGYHIIRFEEYKPEGMIPFEEVREELTAGARRKGAIETRERIVAPLRNAADASIDLDALRHATGAKW